MTALPVLTYHSVAPGERLGPERFAEHLVTLAGSGLPSLLPEDLDAARSGFLLTFDDGFADLWTHGLPLLQQQGLRAAVFAIPSRAGDGPPRPQGERAFAGSANQAHGAAASREGPHPAFLRWSELAALEASGLVRVQSHSHTHRMGWVGERIVGFHLGRFGRTHWSLAQATGGDARLGIPLYPRGSAAAHRLYFDDREVRDRLAGWLAERGGEAYVEEVGVPLVRKELASLAARSGGGRAGRWETQDEREQRTVEEFARARGELEERLGGRRDELCLPWGEYDATTLACARKAGVRRVYTLDRTPNPAGRLGFLVGRFEPRPRSGRWLRRRLWIYRSVLRTRLYGWLARRR